MMNIVNLDMIAFELKWPYEHRKTKREGVKNIQRGCSIFKGVDHFKNLWRGGIKICLQVYINKLNWGSHACRRISTLNSCFQKGSDFFQVCGESWDAVFFLLFLKPSQASAKKN